MTITLTPGVSKTHQGRQGKIAADKSWTFAGTHASENWTVEINGRIVTIAGSTTGALTATNLYTALIAYTSLTNPEIFRFTWTNPSSGVLRAVQKDTEAGKEITITISRVSGVGTVDGGASSTGVVAVASDGPNYYSARNFGGTAPVDSDVIVLEQSRVPLLWNLSQSSTTPITFIHDMSFEADFGLRKFNDKGSRQAQTRYLTLGNSGDGITTECIFGRGKGKGSRFGAYNAGTGQAVFGILNTGTPYPEEEFALYLLGTHTSNVLRMKAGRVGVAMDPGESSALATVIFEQDPDLPRGLLGLGAGCTLTTINNYGGEIRTEKAFTTGVLYLNAIQTHLEGAITTLSIWHGLWNMLSDGTIGTCNIGSAGIFRCLNSRARTITTCNVYKGATIYDPNNSITFTNPINCLGCSPHEVTFVRKPGTTVQFA